MFVIDPVRPQYSASPLAVSRLSEQRAAVPPRIHHARGVTERTIKTLCKYLAWKCVGYTPWLSVRMGLYFVNCART